MKIVALSRNKKLYSTRRLIDAAEKSGHEVEVIDFLKCYMVIKKGNPPIYYDGKKLSGVGAGIDVASRIIKFIEDNAHVRSMRRDRIRV